MWGEEMENSLSACVHRLCSEFINGTLTMRHASTLSCIVYMHCKGAQLREREAAAIQKLLSKLLKLPRG